MKEYKGIIIMFIVTLCLVILSFVVKAYADDECWVLCQPDSFVNVRASSSKNGDVLGRVECGDKLCTDGKTKDGFLHLTGLSFESTEGWIHKGYIVYDEPYAPCFQDTTIQSNGRVAARKTVNGDRKSWLKDGQKIKVYSVSQEWSVTNKGFVKTDYVDLGR